MKILTRLKNIWRLGGVELFPNGHYQTLNPITGESIVPEKTFGYIYEGKPQAKIITRKPLEDNIDKVLKDEN
jgi:hypothetical protein